jgi:ABC-type transporter MlaC component
MLNQHSSISSVARFALGPYRRKLPANQKKEYYSLVQKYVAALFAEYVHEFAGTGVEIEKSRASGKFVIVDSRITSAGTKLRWRVYSRGNKHRITDVNFKGIWLSIRMRDQFVSVLKSNNGDFGALISYLRANS